jgi:hypothetical protein
MCATMNALRKTYQPGTQSTGGPLTRGFVCEG